MLIQKLEISIEHIELYRPTMTSRFKSEWLQVVEEMVRDPSASIQEIADRTGIPKSTVWYAQQRLREEDLIEKQTFLHIDGLDDLKIGIIGGAINGEKDEVLEKVANHPNVWFLVDTIGPHSFTATIVGRTNEEFQSVIETLNEYGAEGDHYGEVTSIPKFGIDERFVKKLTE